MTLGNSTSEMFIIGIIEPSEIPVKNQSPIIADWLSVLALQVK